jgi:3-isopropylmalate/(R)-2-methylmalate dehydratase small subunit
MKELQSSSASRVWKLGPQIDTDTLAPGAYMKYSIDVIAQHVLESVRADFASEVKAGDVIVAGPGFGVGSSREQAAGVLVHLGVKAVIAPSFSGLFFRNAFNLGLLLLTCQRAEELNDGETVVLQGQHLQRLNGEHFECEPIPDFLMDMVEQKGLMNVLKLRMKKSLTPAFNWT